MKRIRSGLSVAVDELNRRNADLQKVLKSIERTIAHVMGRLADGERMVDTAKGSDLPSLREDIDEAIFAFTAARKRSRVELMASAAEEGASLGELGRILGFAKLPQKIEEHFALDDLDQARMLRRRIIDAGYSATIASGVVGWLIERNFSDDDDLAPASLTKYRRVLTSLSQEGVD
jgi:hypothetical protein